MDRPLTDKLTDEAKAKRLTNLYFLSLYSCLSSYNFILKSVRVYKYIGDCITKQVCRDETVVLLLFPILIYVLYYIYI